MNTPIVQDDRIYQLATCGSVDDGKSTLIGRILFDAGALMDDQLAQVADASKRRGLAAPDLALLTDGLRAEREQGITIDVAWRSFQTAHRRFGLADSPGHVQYTCNMAVAASGADAAIVLLDAKKGVVAQTRRHVLLSRLVGVSTFVVCVNKMDAVGFSQARFAEVRDEVTDAVGRLSKLLPGAPPHVHVVPISALTGDNVVAPSQNLAWYDGLPLLRLLERLPRAPRPTDEPFRMAVQWVSRPLGKGSDEERRTYAGRIARGSVRVGDAIVVLPSGQQATVTAVSTLRGAAVGGAGESVTLSLSTELDISRGDVLANASAPPSQSQQPRADIVWLSKRPSSPVATLLVKQGTRSVRAKLASIDALYNLDEARADTAPDKLAQNDVAAITLTTAQPLVFDSFEESRALGSLLMIDPQSGDTLAAGTLRG